MQLVGRAVCALLLAVLSAPAALVAALPSCVSSARAFEPCELSFDLHPGELPPSASLYRDEILNVEFRSPRATTYLMNAFADGSGILRVRFTPIESGHWTYRVSSTVKRLDNSEGNFDAAETGKPGMVGVANLRHWWTTNKQPHLWLSASVPFLALDDATLGSWLDARKHDGFTHVRGALLTETGPNAKPLTAAGTPDPAYFGKLDERVLAAIARGFTVDLIFADASFLKNTALNNYDILEPLVRYLVARYGGLDVTWQGIEHFEDYPNSRSLLKGLAAVVQKGDPFKHPRSTDARVSSSPLLPDGWMNYLIEASPDPQLGAVEHQFTQQPEIHVVTASEPAAFRHELWNCTTNGEYPSVSFEALRDEANIRAVQTWVKVMSDTRHWELEPYFDVDGARAVGLEEAEFVAYAQRPGIVEITLPKHKYNPLWVNPITGEELPLKDYKGEVFSRQTPDSSHDWVLKVPREGHKANMLKYVRFESIEPPVQEVETDTAKIPFEVTDPKGEDLPANAGSRYAAKLTRANRASRTMQYIWWGEIVANEDGARLIGLGSNGNFTPARILATPPGGNLHLRVQAINANGKAYEVDRVYRLTQ
jgi:hypothetical protein